MLLLLPRFALRTLSSDPKIFHDEGVLTLKYVQVIDGIEDLEIFDCRRLIPRCSYGTIVVTSTPSQTAANLGFHGLEISELDKTAGFEMLLSGSSPRLSSNPSMC